MWWFEAFGGSFTLPTAESRLQVFRLLLGLACVIKFAESVRHGGWSRFRPGTYEHHRVTVGLPPRLAQMLPTAYRALLVLRLLAAALVTAGLGTRAALAAVALGLLAELWYEFRSHTVFLLLCCLFLLPAGAPGHGLGFSPAVTPANTWSQALLVLLVVDLYWGSAYCKLRSAQFRSGAVLTQYIHFVHAVRDRVAHREVYYPPAAARLLATGDEASRRRWQPLARLTIALEIALPFGLLIPQTYPIACLAGAGMHTAFTVLLPRRLVPFSLATVASYLLFQP